MILNIYENKEIVKTYKSEAYDLMFGVLEDVANAVKIDDIKTGTDAEIIRMIGNLVLASMETVKNLMKDIFDGITDEELKNTKVAEIAAVLVEVVKFTLSQLALMPKSKN